jgi:hypothetical protein
MSPTTLVGSRFGTSRRACRGSTTRAEGVSWAMPAACVVTRGGIVTLHATGRCTTVASQAGTRAVAPASPVARSFRVSRAAPRPWASLLAGVV